MVSFKKIIKENKEKNTQLMLFIAAGALIGVSQSIDTSIANNFFNDVFHITVTQRTILEIPREFPGLMVVFVSGALMFLGDIRIAFAATLLASLGMLCLGTLSSSFGVMMIWLVMYSMGQHLFMPLSNSIAMTLADKKSIGKVLGTMNGLNTAVFLATSLVTALVFRFVEVNYAVTYAVGALGYLGAAILIFRMKPIKIEKKRSKIFLKKEFSLFYVLSIVNGARKQIFLTFGPWVLIKVFGQSVSTFAAIGFATAAIGIFFKPWVGKLIDRRGEKFVLGAEALLLFVVCAGYAAAEQTSVALGLIIACYVVDQLLNAAGMARATYVSKIAVHKDDVSPTLSMGLSLDHVVSMFIPFAGSLVWNAFGYQYVFVAGALIALLNFAITRKIELT
jgi:predicted MFS family arabinose efflux permease